MFRGLIIQKIKMEHWFDQSVELFKMMSRDGRHFKKNVRSEIKFAVNNYCLIVFSSCCMFGEFDRHVVFKQCKIFKMTFKMAAITG